MGENRDRKGNGKSKKHLATMKTVAAVIIKIPYHL